LVTLDAFVEENNVPRVDILKIDVEGAEVSLLRGAEQSIRRFRPVIMLEMNVATLHRFSRTPADIVSLLGSWRYHLALATRWGGVRPLASLPKQGEPNVFAFPID
jgi:hypothetical protein